MTETVIEIKKTKGTPVRCRDCGEHIGTKGTISRDPRYMLLSSNEKICRDCASNYPWSDEMLKEGGFMFIDMDFTPDPDINLDAPVEPGFVKAMKYSDYTRLAYKLGFEKGKQHEQ